jgi:glutaredoxin
MKKILTSTLAFLLVVTGLTGVSAQAQERTEMLNDSPTVFMFGRDDCGFCKKQFEFLASEGIKYEYLNIVTDERAQELYDAVTAKHEISKVTPVTVIGERVLVGFNGAQTTGQAIKDAVVAAQYTDINSVEGHIEKAVKQEVIVGGGCTGLICEEGEVSGITFDLPLIGVVDLKAFSLFSLSALLGVIDGFNPCAMWVLITFLVLLSQAGSRKKMIMLAGIFIFAQAVMYNLILNVWYKTWDFVALDQYVTPLVGLLERAGESFSCGAGTKIKTRPWCVT